MPKLIKMKCKGDCADYKLCKKSKDVGNTDDEITLYVMNCLDFEDKADHEFMKFEMQNNKI